MEWKASSIVALLLAAAMALTMTAFAEGSDGAAEGLTVFSECERTVPGGTADMTVSARGWSGETSLRLYVEFDDGALTLNGYDVLCDLRNPRSPETAPGIAAIGLEGSPMMGDLVRLHFMVDEDAAEGQYPLILRAEADGGTVEAMGAMMVVAALPGDVNGDGRASALDSLLIVKAMNGDAQSSPAMDLNGDGVVDADDSALLKNHVVGNMTDLYEPPADATLVLRDRDPVSRIGNAIPGMDVRFDVSGKKVLDGFGRTVAVKDGAFAMPAEECRIYASEPSPAVQGKYVLLSLMAPPGISVDTDGTPAGQGILFTGKGSATVTVSGAGFSANGDGISYTAMAGDDRYIVTCIASSGAKYEASDDGLTITMPITGDLNEYAVLLFLEWDPEKAGEPPSVGDMANYRINLKSAIPIGADAVLAVSEIREGYHIVDVDVRMGMTGIVGTESVQGRIAVPDSIPLVFRTDDIGGLQPTGESAFVGISECYAYVPENLDGKATVWADSDGIVWKAEASATVDGTSYGVSATLKDYRLN